MTDFFSITTDEIAFVTLLGIIPLTRSLRLAVCCGLVYYGCSNCCVGCSSLILLEAVFISYHALESCRYDVMIFSRS